jgi:hypothetical protein
MADCEIYSNISFNKVNCMRYGTINDAKKRIVLKRVSITDINSKKKDEIIDSFMVVGPSRTFTSFSEERCHKPIVFV